MEGKRRGGGNAKSITCLTRRHYFACGSPSPALLLSPTSLHSSASTRVQCCFFSTSPPCVANWAYMTRRAKRAQARKRHLRRPARPGRGEKSPLPLLDPPNDAGPGEMSLPSERSRTTPVASLTRWLAMMMMGRLEAVPKVADIELSLRR